MAEEKKEKKEKKKVTSYVLPVLVVLLVGVAFGTGVMWSKIRKVDQEERPKEQKEEEGTLQPEVEEEEGETVEVSPEAGESAVLGEEEIAQLEEGAAGVKGEDGVPVTIVEFSEYQCPFCKRYVDETYGKIWQEYEDKVRYLFHDYPLPFHRHAQKLAEAARCAGDQGDYWGMHDLLFSQAWTNEQEEISGDLADFAQQLGLDRGKFGNCLSSGKYAQAVQDDFELGQSVGVQGTPTFFINGQKLVGAQPLESFKRIIEAELGG